MRSLRRALLVVVPLGSLFLAPPSPPSHWCCCRAGRRRTLGTMRSKLSSGARSTASAHELSLAAAEARAKSQIPASAVMAWSPPLLLRRQSERLSINPDGITAMDGKAQESRPCGGCQQSELWAQLRLPVIVREAG